MIKRFHHGLALMANHVNIDISVLTEKWVAIYELRLSSRGKQDAVKFVKELNTVCERYALRQPITPIPWTKSDSDGFPSCLGNPFKEYLRSGDQRKVVFALSVMRSCEDLRLPISRDIGTVTAPSGAEADTLNRIIDFIPGWVSRFKRQTLPSMKYHYTVKNGPNGNALRSSDSDIAAVLACPILFGSIQIIQRKLGDVNPMKYKDAHFTGNPYIHSKLTQFPEKAGKTRTIAIIDYYSQRCLYPLHKMLMGMLRSMISDGTYSHQNVGRFAQQMTAEKRFIYCADLTAFTDRFPGEIQRVLLSELVQDPSLSKAYWNVLAKRTFKLAWSDELVTYNCGQPMGAYGSWPLCSLAHHLVVEYAAYTVRKNVKNAYKLIGDDVIITEPETAQEYKKIITALGVDINLSKTVETSANAEFSGAEVAKQLYLNGINVTPLTPGLIRDLRKPSTVNQCLEVLKDRYEFIHSVTLPALIEKLFYKRQLKKVWILTTNPINGALMPSYKGCEERQSSDADDQDGIRRRASFEGDALWGQFDLSAVEEEYRKICLKIMVDKAVKLWDNEMAQFYTGGVRWKDPTQPPPVALEFVRNHIQKELLLVMDELRRKSTPSQELLAKFDFVPEPEAPYLEIKETRQRRITQTILVLFDKLKAKKDA